MTVTRSTRRWVTRLAATVVLWSASAEAQTMAQSFEQLREVVKAEETVIVIDITGRRAKGVLTTVDKDSVSLATDGRTRTFAWSEVSVVRVAEGLGNGALIGAGAGLGAATGILAIAGSGDGYVLPSAKVGAPLLLSGIGVLIGVLIDQAHDGGRVLHVSPRQTSELVVSPLLGKDRQGVLVTVRF